MNTPTNRFTCPCCSHSFAAADALSAPPGSPQRASRALARTYCPQCGAELELGSRPGPRQIAMALLAMAAGFGAYGFGEAWNEAFVEHAGFFLALVGALSLSHGQQPHARRVVGSHP